MRAATKTIAVLAIVVAATLAAFLVAPRISVPVRFDMSGVDELQLNGGTLSLKAGPANRLTARVPLTALPILMVRRTNVAEGRVAEVGGFDDSDPRILIPFLAPRQGIPVPVNDVAWTLETDSLERVTVAGGTLLTQDYAAESLVILGIAGEVRLEGLDVDLLAIHTQDMVKVTASGRAGVLSVLDNAVGELDTSGLDAERTDPAPIHEILGEL